MNGNGPFDALRATREERLDLCAYLDTLASEQWRAPSLCPGWTVRDVVAHLTTSTTTTLRHVLFGMIRARGDFDRMEKERAAALARRFTPDDLVRQIRETAGSASRAPGSSRVDPLLDVLVHGQDIARPLGQQRPMRPERAVPALAHAVTSRFYGARKRFGGMRLEATDTSWTFGEGALRVAGPVADLMLVATGRQAGVAALDGSGVDTLTERLAPG